MLFHLASFTSLTSLTLFVVPFIPISAPQCSPPSSGNVLFIIQEILYTNTTWPTPGLSIYLQNKNVMADYETICNDQLSSDPWDAAEWLSVHCSEYSFSRTIPVFDLPLVETSLRYAPRNSSYEIIQKWLFRGEEGDKKP